MSYLAHVLKQFVSHRFVVRQIRELLALVGWVMAAPALLRPLAGVAVVVARRLAPRSGRIGLLHVVRDRSRSGVTVALLMLVP